MAMLVPGVGLVYGSPSLLIPGAGIVNRHIVPTITTTALDPLQVGVAFSQQLVATGDEPITWSVSGYTADGTHWTVDITAWTVDNTTGLPPGLSFSSTGLLSGTPTTSGAYSFTVTATNAGGSDDQLYEGTVSAAVSTRVWGDDKVHPGWSRKRAKLKLDREREFTAQIRDIYRALTGSPQADEAEAIIAQVVPPIDAKGESERARSAAVAERAEALRVRADRLEPDAVQAEIALRLLYREMRERQDAEDFEAVRVLLAEVL